MECFGSEVLEPKVETEGERGLTGVVRGRIGGGEQ